MTDMNPIAGRHLVRYGIAADQKYLIGEFQDTYDQLVINASMVAHMPAALAMFITQRAHKPYFIDPQTHAFQHGIEYLQSNSENRKGEIKRSLQKLLDAYGDPVKGRIEEGTESILPKDFTVRRKREAFCKRVIEFQLTAISQEAAQTDAAPYYEFLRDQGIADFTPFGPSLVVAPYFFMESNTFDEWLKINRLCALDSIGIAAKAQVPLGVQIAISQDILFDKGQSKRLIEAFSDIDASVLLVWVDAFDEEAVSASLLASFARVLKNLGNKGQRKVVNLYGGYFSIMLCHEGILAGVTHSLEYGEQRSVVPVGGGVPVAKYYLPCLHSRMLAREALRAVRVLAGDGRETSFHKKVCDCKQCREVIGNDFEEDFLRQYGLTKLVKGRQYPTAETKDNCVRHYMWCKRKEFQNWPGIKKAVAELQSAHKTLQRAVGIENTAHCAKWAEVIENH